VNVAEGAPVVRFTVAGVNVPPPPPSLGVTVTLARSTPPAGSATVKFVEATPTVPVLGPVSVYVAATDV
jgi:hypothetical protein